ncbi:MAG TPA: YqzL family protein [Firmicutes bacterium]|nr:YqzL family protein [Bacillota bacterium]HHW99188.1 YqzL family protein [Bacillota bacterium]
MKTFSATFFWKVFEETGSILAYLMYRKLSITQTAV